MIVAAYEGSRGPVAAVVYAPRYANNDPASTPSEVSSIRVMARMGTNSEAAQGNRETGKWVTEVIKKVLLFIESMEVSPFAFGRP